MKIHISFMLKRDASVRERIVAFARCNAAAGPGARVELRYRDGVTYASYVVSGGDGCVGAW